MSRRSARVPGRLASADSASPRLLLPNRLEGAPGPEGSGQPGGGLRIEPVEFAEPLRRPAITGAVGTMEDARIAGREPADEGPRAVGIGHRELGMRGEFPDGIERRVDGTVARRVNHLSRTSGSCSQSRHRSGRAPARFRRLGEAVGEDRGAAIRSVMLSARSNAAAAKAGVPSAALRYIRSALDSARRPALAASGLKPSPERTNPSRTPAEGLGAGRREPRGSPPRAPDGSPPGRRSTDQSRDLRLAGKRDHQRPQRRLEPLLGGARDDGLDQARIERRAARASRRGCPQGLAHEIGERAPASEAFGSRRQGRDGPRRPVRGAA